MNVKYYFSPILWFILVLLYSGGGLLRMTCVRPVHMAFVNTFFSVARWNST